MKTNGARGAARTRSCEIVWAMLLLLLCNRVFAQTQSPDTASDPVQTVCPGFSPHPSVPIAFDAWTRGEDLMHIEGDGTMGSNLGHTTEALPWFCKAAAAGGGHAAYAIARILDEGYMVNTRNASGQVTTTQVPADRRAAAGWFELAAKLGYTDGLVDLGLYYLRGELVRGNPFAKDIGRGIELISTAADKGNTRAQMMLAYAYMPGVQPDSPVPKNLQLASKWVARAQTQFKKFQAVCTDPETIDLMFAQITNPQSDRSTLRASIDTVRSDSEYVCRLNLGAGDDQRNPQTSVFGAIFGGQMLHSWAYDTTRIPGTDGVLVRRETAAQALTEAAVDLAPLLNAISQQLQQK